MLQPMMTTHQPTDTVGKILGAALAEFVEVGYHAATVRRIAVRAGVSVPTLYVYVESKQYLLMELCKGAMEELFEVCERAIEKAGKGVIDRFCALLREHIRYHATNQLESFISNSELRSLIPSNRKIIVALRDRHQRLFSDLIMQGVEEGIFHVDELELATKSIVSIANDVAIWYRKSGRLSPDEIADHLVKYSLDLVRASGDCEWRVQMHDADSVRSASFK